MLRVSLGSLSLLAIGLSTGCRVSSESPSAAAITQPEKPSAPTPTQSNENEPIAVQWDRLEMPLGEDNHFEPWMVPSRVSELDGKRVRIEGLIYAGGLYQKGNIREFPLIRELGCQFGSGAPAWHVIMVELEGKLRTEYKTEPIIIEGILRVKPYNGTDGKVWSVYSLQGMKIE